MINGKTVLAVIPARGGSKGLKKKNLLQINGQSLLEIAFKTCSEVSEIDQIICSTEDAEIMLEAKRIGLQTPFKRPQYLSSDEATTADVLLHAIHFFEKNDKFFDYIVLIEVTSPLTEANDLKTGLRILVENATNFDSMVTVAQSISGHPDFTFYFDKKNFDLKPYIGPNWTLKRRQEISDLYFVEGTFYISKIETFKEFKLFIQKRTMGFEVPKWKSFEVDDLLDFKIIELLYNEFKLKRETFD